MSRRIDLQKPLSDEDVEYFNARGSWGERQLAEHQAIRSQQDYYEKRDRPEPDEMSDEEKVKLLEEAEAWIATAKMDELKQRLADEELSTEGKVADLRSRLLDLVTERYS